ncbi:glycoside hydrolase family 130 protein [Sedimentisphaera salicampi]|uniref:Beta-1,4-mannooligosaccharide phosphorylase n=1 Tax=Sedimentisphaera salicampi TaxID=1941349 RepID=A0A1W6LKY7_9BACT|nr:glycoside hydrolase family 130 protein [Sedimentisphaera salicampi]ARN56426.1 Beta-1,4-mannooligosaccharide phosphorylase [Sedimentisphaera salicampi]OXU15311.1 Beta-1,4-mannooligosaccharide phosphorylase [Sedimentisphaera salicampi]
MRFKQNPLITPSDVKASRPDYEVVCVFNPAVTIYRDEIILLLRVAERPIQTNGYISVGVLDVNSSRGDYENIHISREAESLNDKDCRVINYKGQSYTTTISHLRIARSKDGVNFKIEDKPFISASGVHDRYGVEDARITQIDNDYYITFASISSEGVSTALAKTSDWKSYEYLGIIFAPMNKDVVIFPRKINGKYIAVHRPDAGEFARPSMWLASSPDLSHWGESSLLMKTRDNMWDSHRIGAGSVPVETEKGWLSIYHGCNEFSEYRLGLLLQAKNDPSKIIFRSSEPLMSAEEEYEQNGFFNHVVFTDGLAYFPEQDRIFLYYGAADLCVCGAEFSFSQLLSKTDGGYKNPDRNFSDRLSSKTSKISNI